MKIALAQINPTIGDFKGNLQKIEDSLARAENRGVDLCIFPEMAITGYPPQSLLNQNKFVSDNLKFLDQLIPKTGGTAAVIGYVRGAPNLPANRLENVAALISGKEIVSTHIKSKLTSHDTFDECRYFEPASSVRAVDFGEEKLGICFFDDIHKHGSSLVELHRERDSIFELVEQGAEIIVAIGALTFDFDGRKDRLELLKETARRHSRPIVFVNQVGGNDELILDGGSVVLGANGEVLARAEEFKEDFIVVDIESGEGDLREIIDDEDDALIEALVLGTRDYAKKAGFKSAVLDLGADLESSIVAAIAARALGPGNVFGLVMPSKISIGSMVDDVLGLASNLRINLQIIEIDVLLQSYLNCLQPIIGGLSNGEMEKSTQSRIRALVLMSISRAFDHLVLSTFNRSQFVTGQTTLIGNMAGGLSVLSDVSRTLVERIALRIDRDNKTIPGSIIKRGSQEKTLPYQVDETVLPPYPMVDPILERLIDQNLNPQATISEGFEEKTVMEITRLMRINEHKRRQAPPGLRISARTSAGNGKVPLGHHFTT